ncbi:MAG: hypothetical protein QW782_07460 [Candidatus Bathyarchaeia archaeon]
MFSTDVAARVFAYYYYRITLLSVDLLVLAASSSIIDEISQKMSG